MKQLLLIYETEAIFGRVGSLGLYPFAHWTEATQWPEYNPKYNKQVDTHDRINVCPPIPSRCSQSGLSTAEERQQQGFTIMSQPIMIDFGLTLCNYKSK